MPGPPCCMRTVNLLGLKFANIPNWSVGSLAAFLIFDVDEKYPYVRKRSGVGAQYFVFEKPIDRDLV